MDCRGRGAIITGWLFYLWKIFGEPDTHGGMEGEDDHDQFTLLLEKAFF
jgi:hypothetical protein